jgi:hypothetical protein
MVSRVASMTFVMLLTSGHAFGQERPLQSLPRRF